MTRSFLVLTLSLGMLFLATCGKQEPEISAPASGAGAARPADQDAGKPPAARAASAIDRAIQFLQPYHDKKSGKVGFSPQDPVGSGHPAFSAMAALCYVNSPRRYDVEKDGPIVRNILQWLVSLQNADGSIYDESNANYVTSLALRAFVAAGDPRYQDVIVRARDFLVGLQAREDTGYQPSDRFYGGIGYGSSIRPDLSNAHFAIQAVKDAGLPEDHPFYQRAQRFLERCQNWSETNDLVVKDEDGNEIRPGNDGGGYYAPGESKIGVEVQADGTRVLKSYGSMSYALLKSYVFCGVKKQDPRVKAVVSWCQNHFDLDRHPGFPTDGDGKAAYQGLYYYYLTMAMCLRAYGETEFDLPDGTKVNWAEAMIEKILGLQQADGGWVNEKNGRWQEGSEALCTLYAVMALEECLAALAS